MIGVALLLACAGALAGRWLPEAPVEVTPDAPWRLEQPAGGRRLLEVVPPEAQVEAWSGGVRLPLSEGPGDTLLLGAAATSREVSLQVSTAVRVRWWRETEQGESAAWDAYTAALGVWAARGGAVPVAPADIPALQVWWGARRQAMVAMGELDQGLLVTAALQELDEVRTGSRVSYAGRDLAPEVLPAGGGGEVEVQGPGRLTLATRLSMDGALYRRYDMQVELDGEPAAFGRYLTTEDAQSHPGWGWGRSLTLVVPAGVHSVAYGIATEGGEGGQVEVTGQMEVRRPSIAAAHAARGPRSVTVRAPGSGQVAALEAAHLAGADQVISLARALLDGPAGDLARARLIQHTDDPLEAGALFKAGPATPLTALALCERWLVRRDVSAEALQRAAPLLPMDPALLAALADDLPWSFVRPRGRAIRMLAGIADPSAEGSRWMQLLPDHGQVDQRVSGVGGGIPRVRLVSGSLAEVELPAPSRDDRFPVLRIEARAPTVYRIDGAPRRGIGALYEALSPGRHTVGVDQGEVFLMDAAFVTGGEPCRDRAAGPLPNRWNLPDPGAPGELDLRAWGPPGSLFLTTDDGAVTEVRLGESTLDEGGYRLTLPLGAHAASLRVDGDSATLVSIAMRRINAEADAPTPSPWPDPLAALAEASQDMLGTRDPRQLAGLKLRRAAARGALGLTVSAGREAGAVAADAGATPDQRAEAQAIQRQVTAPVQTAAAPGPVTVEASLAVVHREVPRPLGCDDLGELSASLSGPVSWPIHSAASACALERGDMVEAWREGASAGAMGRVARLKVAAAGRWVVLTRMDMDGGTQHVELRRTGPDEGDGLYAVVRELALGVPWDPSEYSVLRGGKSTGLSFAGEGDLDLELVCRDESYAVSPAPCAVQVVVDGAASEVEIPEAAMVRWSAPLSPGEHRVQVVPSGARGQALVVRSSLGGVLLPPRMEVTTHIVGARGARATVAGGRLIRVRVHDGGPVVVEAQGQHAEVADVGVFALEGGGPVPVRIEGPADAAFTLSHLMACVSSEEVPIAAPVPLESTTPDPVAVALMERWMREVAVAPSSGPLPVGRGGTTQVWAGAGDDASGIRDARVHYPYLGAAAGWARRIDGSRHWVEVQGVGRLGITGAPGAHLDGAWTWAPGRSLVALAASLGASGGTGHAALEGTARRSLSLGPWWELRPHLGLHVGHYGAAQDGEVDPLAWSEWSADHWFGGNLGTDLDWRLLRDARLRLSTDLDTNPDATLDRAAIAMRFDALALPSTVLRLGGELGYRFEDSDRAEAYVRPVVQAGLGYSGFTRRTARWSVQARADWLLPDGGLEGWLRYGYEWSAGRGLRDHTPDDQVFSDAQDLPLGL